jgi:carbon storage regulator
MLHGKAARGDLSMITRRLKMLRLSVNKDEYLMVGKDVKITFLGGNDRTLRLMIDAPKEVNVARGKAIEKRAHMNENQ